MNSSSRDIDVINLDSDEEVEFMKYHIVETSDGTTYKLPHYCLAEASQPNPHIKLRSKTRVIARRKQENSPSTATSDLGFFPGITSHKSFFRDGCWNYLIFFDDGHAQHVPIHEIRVVFGNYGTKYVHENAQRFYDYYFDGVKQTKLPELGFRNEQCTKVFRDGEFQRAKVILIDEGLAKLHFSNTKHSEWLYVGSPRFEIVWHLIIKNKRLERYQQVNMTLLEVSSDSEEDDDDYQSPK